MPHKSAKLNVFHLRCLRGVLGASWQDKVTNNEVFDSADIPSVQVTPPTSPTMTWTRTSDGGWSHSKRPAVWWTGHRVQRQWSSQTSLQRRLQAGYKGPKMDYNKWESLGDSIGIGNKNCHPASKKGNSVSKKYLKSNAETRKSSRPILVEWFDSSNITLLWQETRYGVFYQAPHQRKPMFYNTFFTVLHHETSLTRWYFHCKFGFQSINKCGPSAIKKD